MGASAEEAENIVMEIFGDLTRCIEEEEESRKDHSSSEVREYSNCVMDAGTFDDLQKCDAWDKD